MKNEKLVVDNMNLVYFLLHKYYPLSAKDEDVIQCGMVGLCKAADTWDETKSKFSTYASMCILNEFRMEFRRRRKYERDLSLDRPIQNQDGENLTYQDFIEGESDVDFVDYNGFYDSLSESEQKIVDLAGLGVKQEDIAEILGTSQANVSRKLTKIRKKWGKFSDAN